MEMHNKRLSMATLQFSTDENLRVSGFPGGQFFVGWKVVKCSKQVLHIFNFQGGEATDKNSFFASDVRVDMSLRWLPERTWRKVSSFV